MPDDKSQKAADLLFQAHDSGRPCDPVRELIGLEPDAGYTVQAINTRRWVDAGRRIVGRKIGLTSRAVQQQLGVDQPDFGVLFADMESCNGEEVPFARLQQPKAEAEIALVIGRDIDHEDITYTELLRAVDYVAPAIEIVGSRVRDWDIKISDTIADNASSGLYVLGEPVRRLDGLDLVGARMAMKCNGRPASFGAGLACLGNPLNAALWLARKCAALGESLKAGDVVLTGALGPMTPMAPGDFFDAQIEGLGGVSLAVGRN